MNAGLLVIDMIDGIAINGSCADYVKQYAVLDAVNKSIATFNASGLPIYHVRLQFDQGYPDIPKYSKLFNAVAGNHKFLSGSQSVEFMPGIGMDAGALVFNKTAVSPFHHSGLLERLRADQVDHLVFTGLATDNAINLGARIAHDEGFYTTIVADACGASTIEDHDAALKLLEKIVNQITTSDKLHLL